MNYCHSCEAAEPGPHVDGCPYTEFLVEVKTCQRCVDFAPTVRCNKPAENMRGNLEPNWLRKHG